MFSRKLWFRFFAFTLVTACEASEQRSPTSDGIDLIAPSVKPLDAPATSSKLKTATKLVAQSSSSVDALALPKLAHASLRSYPVELRCEALRAAVESFVTNYAPDVSLRNLHCTIASTEQSAAYRLQFDLGKADIRLSTGFSLSQMNAALPNYRAFTRTAQGDSQRENAGYELDSDLASLSPKLAKFHITMLHFVSLNVPSPPTIFDSSYRDFISAASTAAERGMLRVLQNDGEKVPLTLKLEAADSFESQLAGSCIFLDVPPTLLQQTAAATSDVGLGGFLGCETLPCLNDGSVSFAFEEQRLLLTRLATQGDGQKVAYTAGWSFQLMPKFD